MDGRLSLLLVVCEGKTEAIYFNILRRMFRLPTWIKIVPDVDEDYRALGQHEALLVKANEKGKEYARELGLKREDIEVWAVCDRDNYRDSFTKLRDNATALDVSLAFSDPQFENFLLQHFSANRSKLSGKAVEKELSEAIAKGFSGYQLYKKADLVWLEKMIDKKHAIIKTAIKNAEVHSNHTKQPFFTVQRLVARLLVLGGIEL